MSDVENQRTRLTGGCLCGRVRYQIDGTLRGVINCFCSQCRKTSGHYVAATRVQKKELTVLADATLKWYQSSHGVHRGFCRECGGNVFWDDSKNGQISVMAGTIDAPTGLKTIENIFVQDASDYYQIPELADH